jgi:NTP pyrophosphatase (non-canonical NTP hydrolase)
MQSSEYQAQFGRTLAPVFFPQNVNPVYVGRALRNRNQSARIIDALKRALYYNKTDKLALAGEASGVTNEANLPYNVESEILHAILGMEGEVAEITEAALAGDRAKIIDEAGDFLWYLALLLKNHDISLDEVYGANIAKLKARFPDKFTLDAAVNRNLEAEAAVFN